MNTKKKTKCYCRLQYAGGVTVCVLVFYLVCQISAVESGLRTTKERLSELQIENCLLFELYARQPLHMHLADSALNVLCLGNSITKHPVREEVEWYSDWGMAASRKENDYCHVLERMLKERNPSSTVTPLNIAHWERNLACNIDSLIGNYCKGRDLIIIRLGENVGDIEQFYTSLSQLVVYCERYTTNIIITGNFWRSPLKEKALMSVAHITAHPFVPLCWIAENHEVYPQVGDTLLDKQGQTYAIEHDFIITHPNDDGMRMIAEEIFKAID